MGGIHGKISTQRKEAAWVAELASCIGGTSR